jgi:hypothetical protein
MKPSHILIFTSLAGLMLFFSCTDQFNDPNPKGGVGVQNDSIIPTVALTTPLEGAIYADSLFVRMAITDSFNLKSVSAEIAALDASVLPFKYVRQPSFRFHVIDTMFSPNLSDTTDFQMLIQASDSTGNVLAKTVNFKMYKP